MLIGIKYNANRNKIQLIGIKYNANKNKIQC
jgi:hypothetical protein